MDIDLAFAAIETAVIHLYKGLPLFPDEPALKENNEWLRQQLIRASLLALDLLRREGAAAEETPPLARVRRAYTSE